MQAPAILPNLPVPAGSDIARIFLLYPAGFLSFDISIWVFECVHLVHPALVVVCGFPSRPSGPCFCGCVHLARPALVVVCVCPSGPSGPCCCVCVHLARPALVVVCVSIWPVRPWLLCVGPSGPSGL